MVGMRRFISPLPLLAALVLAACGGGGGDEATAPAGWRLELVASGVNTPWSLNFAPDGRLLFTSRDTGTVSALDVSSGEVTELGRVEGVRAEGEAGLLGMALDPDFAENGRLYLCYSYSDAGRPANRVSAFVLGDSGLGDERVLIDGMIGSPIHNGCRLVVAPDGTLFATIGDGSEAELAQDPNALAGKILNVRTDGSAPAEVWSLGHRNPQGLGFQPGTDVLWSTEHGPDEKDELNVIERGGNYGWPLCEGDDPCPDVESYHPAIREYEEDSTIAISDLVFYEGDAFPAWTGDLLFVTLKNGLLYRLTLDGRTVAGQEIVLDGDEGRLRDVTVGPDGFLYISTDQVNGSRILRLRPL